MGLARFGTVVSFGFAGGLPEPVDPMALLAKSARLATGEDPLDAVAGLTAAVEAAAPGSRLNFLLSDGTTLIGTTWTHALSLLETPAGVLLSSEPLDGDPRWRPVPDHHAVRATAAGVDLLPLTEERS